MHQVSVIRQGPDDGVFINKLELLLTIPLALEQLADGPQSVGAMAQSRVTGSLDGVGPVAVRQAEQAHQHPHPRDTPLLNHLLRPPARLGADQTGLAQVVGGPTLDARAFLGRDVARGAAEPAGLFLEIELDLLELVIVDAHGVAVPPHPDRTTQGYSGGTE